MSAAIFEIPFSLTWRLCGSRNLQPVIRRELDFPDGISWRPFYANGPQDPPPGVFERLFQSHGHPPESSTDKGRTSAWTWIAGRDDYLPSASSGVKRVTEWIGYEPAIARLLYPCPARVERVRVDARRVLLKEQLEAAGTVIGVRAFALSCGECVQISAFANGEAVFFSEDPELVTCDGRAELALIAETLSRP